MVRNFLLFLLLPSVLFAGEFTATVSRNPVNLGESFTLSLTLKGASAKGSPEIGVLKNSFVVHSQQQTSNTVIMNGQVTASVTWKYVLSAQKEGDVVIPSVNIDSSNGILSSYPLTIRVVKGTSSADSDVSDTSGLTLTTDVSHAKPYKNEPFIYTVRLTSDRSLANVSMQKLHMEDAIIEINGEPKIAETFVNGVNVGVLEYSYVITPLKSGALKIPSTVIQGGIQIKRKARVGSFFDDDFDPFSMMQGFDRLKPFALVTEEVVLDVQMPIASVNPWLPAKSLKIEEDWNESQLFRVGDPFTRGFKIVAEGVMSSQLPNLNESQIGGQSFKIYADKPELGDKVHEGRITSYRNEQFTIIPQQEGTVTLPEIAVAWWDVSKNEKVVTRLPSRSLSVLPAPVMPQNSQTTQASEVVPVAPESRSEATPRDLLLYISIAGLAALLFVAIFWGVVLQKKIARLTESSAPVKKAVKRENRPQVSSSKIKEAPLTKEKDEKLPKLNPT